MELIMKRKIIYLFTIFFLFTGLIFSQKVSYGEKIMICAHPLAAKAGLKVFHEGGNVVDVAVATAYALGVVEPYGSGIGGEGMMIIYQSKEKKFVVIDFKAIAPKLANYDNLNFKDLSSWSRTIKGASVPGAVAGLELALEKFGKIDRKKVIQPAIDYALNGFEVDSSLALNLITYKKFLDNDEYSKKIYYPNGEPLKRGDKVINKDYGKTLIEIRDNGAEAFYKGKIADKIVKDSKKNGGFITKEDLLSYKPIIREPLIGEYKGYKIVTTPPPCGGMHLIEALNMLSFFNLSFCRDYNEYSIHILSEVFKRMFIDEATFNADPEFYDVPVNKIISKDFAFQRFKEINLSKPTDTKDIKIGVIGDKNTTHLTVMDIEGNTVTLTITLSSLFGTSHTVEGCGFHLNNEMQNFNPDENHPNSLKPHKRVVTSLVPTIVMKGDKPFLATGTPGGDLILSTITQILVNVLDFNMELKNAMDYPRIFSTYYQPEIEVENRFSKNTVDFLSNMGYEFKSHTEYKAYFGAVQSIMYDDKNRKLIGVSDVRRSGAAIGE